MAIAEPDGSRRSQGGTSGKKKSLGSRIYVKMVTVYGSPRVSRKATNGNQSSYPPLTQWDKWVRLQGSAIGGIIVGGAIGSFFHSTLALIVGGCLGLGIGLTVSILDAVRASK